VFQKIIKKPWRYCSWSKTGWKRHTIRKDRPQRNGPKILSLRIHWKQAKHSRTILWLPNFQLLKI